MNQYSVRIERAIFQLFAGDKCRVLCPSDVSEVSRVKIRYVSGHMKALAKNGALINFCKINGEEAYVMNKNGAE